MDDFDIPDIIEEKKEDEPIEDEDEPIEDEPKEDNEDGNPYQDGQEEFPEFEVTFDQLGHTSAIGGAGQQSRYFDILRRINATESENFLEQMSIFYSKHDMPFNQQNNVYSKLLVNYPHPRFLNVPLCFIAMNYFYSTSRKRCDWSATFLKDLENDITNSKSKSLDVLLPIVKDQKHDIYRYILLMNQFNM